MARNRGMTLEEAAGGGPAPRSPAAGFARFSRARAADARGLGAAARMTDAWIRADKARRAAAMRQARGRGLDGGGRREAGADIPRARQRSDRRRDPFSHARVLLAETSLPLKEICALTGLDIYRVVGMKLKMRGAG